MKRTSAGTFSGAVRVTGPNGYRTTRPVDMTSSRQEHQMTVPVFCSSSLPVFRVRLIDEAGKELDRAQKRYRSVFGFQTSVVGISSAFAGSVQSDIRQRISKDLSTETRFVTAERDVLTDLGRWPGLFDRVYLKRSAKLAVPVETSTRRLTSPMTGANRIPQVRFVDSGVYDVFERPEVSEEREAWMRNAILVGLFVLLAGLFFCFFRPSSSVNWGFLLVLPVLIVSIMYATAPRAPSVLRQSVSVRVSDEALGIEVQDQRAAIYPLARRSSGASVENPSANQSKSNENGQKLEYPLRSIRRTIPVFYQEDALPERFPELRENGAQRSFYWENFPEDGYFVLQEFNRIRMEGTLSLKVKETKNGITIRNQSEFDLRNGWLRMNGAYLRFGRVPEGTSKTVSRSLEEGEGLNTRDRFLEKAFKTGQQQRIQRRWMKYVLQLYDSKQPMVGGVLEGSRSTEWTVPDHYGQVRLPELVLHRFRRDEQK